MTEDGAARIDFDTDKGAHAGQRLKTERVAWMTTVASDGTPQTSPIWFLWDEDEFLVYSLESARVRNIIRNPRVALNLDGDGLGGDVVIVEGTARIDHEVPSAAENADYLAKYKPVMDDNGWTPKWFAGRYSVAIQIVPTRYRHW